MPTTVDEMERMAKKLLLNGASYATVISRTGLSSGRISKIEKEMRLTREKFMEMAGRPEEAKAAESREVEEKTSAPAEEPETGAAEPPAVQAEVSDAPAREAEKRNPGPRRVERTGRQDPRAASPWNAHQCEDAPDGRAIRMCGRTPVIDMKSALGSEGLPVNYCPWCGVKLT